MSQRTSLERSQKRWPSTIGQVLRFPIVWLGLLVLLVLLATPTLLVGTRWAVHASTPVPADVFMQSVVKRDGTLGWHQLCPALQAKVPLGQITEQASTQLAAEAGQGVTLSVDYIGAHSRPQGGQLRFYVVIAHRPNGWVGLRTYIVSTQASGCVEDVQNL